MARRFKFILFYNSLYFINIIIISPSSSQSVVYLYDPLAVVFCCSITSRLLLQINDSGEHQQIVYLDGKLQGNRLGSVYMAVGTTSDWTHTSTDMVYDRLGTIGVTVSVLSLAYCL